MFISFEGIDGCGKSTAIALTEQWLQQSGQPCLLTREPGGTPIAEAIREILLQQWSETLSQKAEQLLLFAGREQHLSQVIKPALDKGMWVLCDRFTDSTFAYQGADELTDFLIDQVHADCWPDITFWLDVRLEVAAQRVQQRPDANRFDKAGLAFQTQLAKNYERIHKQFPQRIMRIDANPAPQAVMAQIQTILEGRLNP